MDIQDVKVNEITDTVGATRMLATRFGRPYSVDSLHQLVKQGRLRAFLFTDGVLVERVPGEQTRGKDLIFLRADLLALPQPKPVGRPKATAS